MTVSLSGAEWGELKDIYLANIGQLTAEKNLPLALIVYTRSLRFNRFDCFLTTRAIAVNFQFSCFGMTGSRLTVWRQFADLTTNRIFLVSVLPAPYRSPKTKHCIINYPGLLSYVIAQVRLYSAKIDTADELFRLGGLLDGVKNHFKERGWPMAGIIKKPGITSFMADGLEKSKMARARRQAKRNNAGKLKAVWIQAQMREYCKEVGAAFSDVWKGKEFGSARYWLDQCELEGKDTKKLLYAVCLRWVQFRGQIYHEDSGKVIRLPETVSFSKYFTYRREIESWLATHEDAPPVSPVETVVIKKVNR